MRRIPSLFLCLVLLISSLLTGCSTSNVDTGTGGQKTKLRIEAWGIETDPNSKIIKEAVDLYNKRSETAEIEIAFTESEQYKTKIATLMAANEAPDLFNTWAAGFLKTFVNSGKVYSISEDLENDPEWKNSYVNGIFDALTFDGKIYAAPTTQTVVCLFYNKEIFDRLNLKVPETYSELKEVIRVLNENGIIPFALGNKAPWVGAMYSEIIANRIGGGEPFKKVYEGTGTWLDPSFIRAGEIMYELAQMNAFPEGFNALDNDPAQELFKEEKAAMLVMGSWAIQQLTNDESPVKDKVDVAKFPIIENGKGSINSWLGQPDQSFAISANCKDKKAAVEFLKT
ncbi:ABC transporter substrate-binding protein [Thermoclostridium stercorarium]|nr:extracellular solute-binding protein [Thermoclostridium stercorarium]